ncbi:hypothetical protein KA082_00540, partial [Candidatus Woesebacteria bacterium]|nr:hypothetical protein [Candidatus Woesebacteria bacterium]
MALLEFFKTPQKDISSALPMPPEGRMLFENDPVKRKYLFDTYQLAHKENLKRRSTVAEKNKYILLFIGTAIGTLQPNDLYSQVDPEDKKLFREAALSDAVLQEIKGDYWQSATEIFELYLQSNTITRGADTVQVFRAVEQYHFPLHSETLIFDQKRLLTTTSFSAIKHLLLVYALEGVKNGAPIRDDFLQSFIYEVYLHSLVEPDGESQDILQLLLYELRTSLHVGSLHPLTSLLEKKEKQIAGFGESEGLRKLKQLWTGEFAQFLKSYAAKEQREQPQIAGSQVPLRRIAHDATSPKGLRKDLSLGRISFQEFQQQSSRHTQEEFSLESAYTAAKSKLREELPRVLFSVTKKAFTVEQLSRAIPKDTGNRFVSVMEALLVELLDKNGGTLNQESLTQLLQRAEEVIGPLTITALFDGSNYKDCKPIVRLLIIFYLCISTNGVSYSRTLAFEKLWAMAIIEPHVAQFKDLERPASPVIIKAKQWTPIQPPNTYKSSYEKARKERQERMRELCDENLVVDADSLPFLTEFQDKLNQLAQNGPDSSFIQDMLAGYPDIQKKMRQVEFLLATIVASLFIADAAYLLNLLPILLKKDMSIELIVMTIASGVSMGFVTKSGESGKLQKRYERDSLHYSKALHAELPIGSKPLNTLDINVIKNDLTTTIKKENKQKIAVACIYTLIITLFFSPVSGDAATAVKKNEIVKDTVAQLTHLADSDGLSEELNRWLADFLGSGTKSRETAKRIEKNLPSNNEKPPTKTDPQFLSYGAQKLAGGQSAVGTLWTDQIGGLQPDSPYLNFEQTSQKLAVPIEQVTSLAELKKIKQEILSEQTDVMGSSSGERMVRMNIAIEDPFYGIPLGYTVEKVISVGAVTAIADSPVGFKVIFPEEKPVRVLVVY